MQAIIPTIYMYYIYIYIQYNRRNGQVQANSDTNS